MSAERDIIEVAFNRTTEIVAARSQRPPERVLHFTDAAGLRGIVSSRVIWLSRARSLNDVMEIQHGLDVAEEVLRDAEKRERYPPELEFIREALWVVTAKDQQLDQRQFAQVEAHVACFAEPESGNRVTHWPLYGAGGAGFAVVFDVGRLPRTPPDLFRIEYDEQEQRGEMESAFKYLLSATQSQQGRTRLVRDRLPVAYVGSLCGYAMIQLAAGMKYSGWASEREWRLVVSQIDRGALPGPDLVRKTRSREGEVVSFFELPFEQSAVTEVIMGPKVDPDLGRADVQALLDSAGYEGVVISKSELGLR